MNEMLSIKKRKYESGQATVEYVLLLVIAVALILGLANQLIKPFGNWMQDYMGQYMECLIDMGELPTVGGGSASGECNSKFSSFSVKNGRPPLNPGGGGRSGSNPSGKGDSDRSASNSKRNSSDETSAGSGGANSNGGTSSSSRGKGFPVGAQGGADTPGSGMAEGAMVEKLPDSKFFKNRSSSSSASVSSSNTSSSNDSFTMPMAKNQQTEKEKSGSRSLKSDPIDIENQRGKKFVVKPVVRKIAEQEEESEWSFGQYIKFAIILAIIIALLLFILGQVAQISKSMEK